MKRTHWLLAATFALALAAGMVALTTPAQADPPLPPNCTRHCKPFLKVGGMKCPNVGCFETGECAYIC